MSRFVLVLLLALSAAPVDAASRVAGDLPRDPERPLEDWPGLDTEYGVLDIDDGTRLRTIVTKPAREDGRLPAVLFVQWLSCDSIELSATSASGWQVMLRRLVTESGWLWMRTDKAGVGDSTGNCAELDYATELAHHRAALAALRARADVDPRRIAVYGASMGSNYAPLVAADSPVAGVVVWGGGATTWFERMLRFERNALELGGADGATLDAAMRERARFFSRYLLERKAPLEIGRDDGTLAGTWARIVGTGTDGTHYGRPAAFHQQAQQQDWARAWTRVDAPVLVLYGEHDWFESRDAAATIPRVVNRLRPGTAKLVVVPGLDHHFTRYDTPEAAFAGRGGKEQAAPVVDAILAWLRER